MPGPHDIPNPSPQGWYAVTLSNPGAGTILLDTGPLAPNRIAGLNVPIWTDSAADMITVALQHIDSAGAVVHQQRFRAFPPFDWLRVGGNITLADGERLRLVNLGGAITGTVELSLFCGDPG